MQSPLGIFSLVIVVTHHAPSYKGTVAPKCISLPNNEISSGLCTDLDHMLRLLVTCFIHGHSHGAVISCSTKNAVWSQIKLAMFKKRRGVDPEFCVEID